MAATNRPAAAARPAGPPLGPVVGASGGGGPALAAVGAAGSGAGSGGAVRQAGTSTTTATGGAAGAAGAGPRGSAGSGVGTTAAAGVAPSTPQPEAVVQALKAKEDEVAALQRRVAELEARLTHSSGVADAGGVGLGDSGGVKSSSSDDDTKDEEADIDAATAAAALPGGRVGDEEPLLEHARHHPHGVRVSFDDAVVANEATTPRGSAWSSRSAPELSPTTSEATYLDRPRTMEAKTEVTSEAVFIEKVKNNLATLQPGRKPVVLVCTGAYNPVHLQHVRMFYLARSYLQDHFPMQVVGGLMSPAHDNFVRQTMRVDVSQAIPAGHRTNMCRQAVAGSSWLSVGVWEATRNLVMDWPSVIRHVQGLLGKAFPGDNEPQVVYLCGADHLVKTIGRVACTCVCVARPGFTEELRKAVGRKYKSLVHIVDDDSVLPNHLDAVSSTKVRKRMLAAKDTTDLVGNAVAAYIDERGIADKVSGRAKWTEDDRSMKLQ